MKDFLGKSKATLESLPNHQQAMSLCLNGFERNTHPFFVDALFVFVR